MMENVEGWRCTDVECPLRVVISSALRGLVYSLGSIVHLIAFS
jgi:hypothetical protein